ncbi:MAG: hypothetical protein WA786_06060 [Acidimicrobiales bacterium]
MIFGAHVIIFSQDAEADRVFLRDILHFNSVDAGGGWLVFALPPAEVALHPGAENGNHELFLITDDLAAEMASLKGQGVECSAVEEPRWGSVTRIRLPGGGDVALYQPKVPLALAPTSP